MGAADEHYRRGLTLYGKRDFAGAIDAYLSALEERPEWTDCLQALGMAQMNAGRLEAALESLEQVTRLTPEEPLAFTSLSMCLQRLNRIADAEAAQSQARLLSWKRELRQNPGAHPPTSEVPGGPP